MSKSCAWEERQEWETGDAENQPSILEQTWRRDELVRGELGGEVDLGSISNRLACVCGERLRLPVCSSTRRSDANDRWERGEAQHEQLQEDEVLCKRRV